MKDDKIVDLADLQDGAILLRMRDVASILQLGESTVKAMVQRGELPVVRCGRAVRVPRRELEAWVSQRTEWATTGSIVDWLRGAA